MASFNKVFLIGNLTRDPVLRRTPNGTAVTDLGVACNRVYTTKEGERREDVTFIDVTVWDRLAENCCEYLKKGRQVHIEGSLKMDTWDDKTTGEKKQKLKVNAEQVLFLGPSPGGSGDSAEDYGGGRESAPGPRRTPAPEPRGQSNGPTRGGSPPPAQPRRPASEPEPTHDDDEDIPF